MPTVALPTPLTMPPGVPGNGFLRWLQTHRGAIAMAAMLAFAGPLTFFTGALGVMRTPTPIDVARLGLWWTLYGVSLGCLLVVAGYACERFVPRYGRCARAALWLLAACVAAALANLVTAGRTAVLLEQGLVHSTQTMHLHGFLVSLTMALLYFAHLRRSRDHERAAARLAAAQAAQRQARRRIVEARLQELQARIDPMVLFEMLEAARRLYERDSARAERLLDDLIAFLRAALPRVRTATSTLAREVELARAFARLHALAGADALEMTVEVAPAVIHARFPPGVMLPLLEQAVRGGAGQCRISVDRRGDSCSLVVALGAAPSPASIERVRALLSALHADAAALRIDSTAGAIHVIVTVPYELG
jgi:hypothetical protein